MVEPGQMDQEMHRQMIAGFDGERARHLIRLGGYPYKERLVMPARIAIGTVVVLNSGGPEMTVMEQSGLDPKAPILTVRCQWLSGGCLMDGWFPEASLTRKDSL